jgi:protein phosphatase 1 regulatory subunit 11
VVDNEGLGRKSSKRCCIFHKKKAFGESSTESDSDHETDKKGKKGEKKIARPKKGDQPPDFQRYHA